MNTILSRSLILAISILAFSIVIQAQLPEFTRIDTGSIYESQGSLAHFSGILFDIDNDGDLDPVISSENAIGYPSSQLALYRNERNGVYKQEVLLPGSNNPFGFYPSPMGDIDNDGDIDVMASNYIAPLLGVFVNDGYGNFLSDTIINVQNTFYPIYPVLLDYNKDGYLDLLHFSSSVKVYYNNGKGNFHDIDTLTNINRPDDWLHSMAWGDADNDGDMDVYCGFSRGIEKNAFFINTGDSLAQVDENHITLSDVSITPSVNWVDYDNDGDMDLFVLSEDPDTINGVLPALYENLGNLEFEKHIFVDEMYIGSYTISSYWEDLDNDGDQDLFITLEDGPFPLSGPYEGQYSPTPYNIFYLNEGNGQFTNLLNHTLTLGEAHTAKIFDQDNDGDLDVLTIGNAYDIEGHNYLYINEGNDNSSVSISCVDQFNCATPYGTRVYAKTVIDGEFISQIRELSLIDGNVAFAYTPVHFGLGDADIIDTLVIRWPSGHVDEYLNVQANQFFRAVEADNLGIDFKATNYIQYSPGIPDINIEEIGENTTVDLKEHFHFIKGDTVPEIIGDTITFSVYNIENPGVVQATVSGSILTLEADTIGETIIQIKASAVFTERVDQFEVKVGVGLTEHELVNPIICASPNPFKSEITITYEILQKSNVNLVIYNYYGQLVSSLINEVKRQGKHEIQYDGKELPAGIYFCVLKTNKGMQTTKMIKL